MTLRKPDFRRRLTAADSAVTRTWKKIMRRSLGKVDGDSRRSILQSLRARLREGRKSPDAAQLRDAECSRFLREYETFHANLRERDPDAWAELERERMEFDGSLMDGLHDE